MAKKKYEKPIIKAEKLFEAAAKTCCKISGVAECNNFGKSGSGKGAQADTTS